jgi:tRNA A37 threonylcarbamoyladenosine dehydratase
MDQLIRTELLLGEEALITLKKSRVAVFGLGGVGGYAVEALARSGVGALDLIDDDRIALSNLNRQIIALHSTVGMFKAEVAARRVLDINPACAVTAHKTFYSPETAGDFDFSSYDYVIDAIDTVTAKISLVLQSKAAGTPIICCMGTGNKLNPAALEVADLYSTSVCPLARVMRRELRRRGVDRLKVVYSREEPLVPAPAPDEDASAHTKRQTPGSTAFVPPAAGLLLASEVVRDLLSR